MISRRIRICLFFLTCLLVVGVVPIYGTDPAAELPFDVDALSAVLMDVETGEILYAKNPDESLPPASVTKIMTLLLVMEAIDSGQIMMSDMVSVSENAASMGGSQVYLEPGEQMRVVMSKGAWWRRPVMRLWLSVNMYPEVKRHLCAE